MRVKGDDTPIAPGEFRDVDVAAGTIRDNILPLPYKEPSTTLYNLLNTIVDEGRRFAATADMKISDMSGNSPVGTTLALLERQLKVMTAVQARLHYTLKREFKLLKDIIKDYTDPDYEYTPEYGNKKAKREDYDKVDLIPVSDPNAATMSQRVVQYQAVIQMAQMAPDIYNLPELHRSMLNVLGIKNAEKLVPLEDDMKPKDPVTENMDLLRNEPAKAFFYQDHEAHIQVHMAAAQDPLIQQLVGQSPKAAQIMAALSAHVAEHVAYAYRQKIEQQLGMPLPPEKDNLPPEMETALSGMMAQAAQQVLVQNQARAAQQQAQQQMQDPMFQMQMQELELEKAKVAIQEKKLAADAATQADKLELERAKAAANIELEQMKLQAQDQREGMRMGLDISREKEKLDLQRKQAAVQHMQNVRQTIKLKEKPNK